MNKRNYQKELDGLLEKLESKKTLFLHCCCAPCSSYVLEYLASYFRIIIYFYNPNITEEIEYYKRKEELKRLVREKFSEEEIDFVDADYAPDEFFAMAKGYEKEPECGIRCFRCYEQRLRSTVEQAKLAGADYFCTTLSISPHKNAEKLMEIGERLGEQYEISYLPSDFKKKNGYKRSIELSREYNLYRQDYCGCVFSKQNK